MAFGLRISDWSADVCSSDRLRGVFSPVRLVVLVLGVIFPGIATPVEAAGIGTCGPVFVAAMHRRLSWPAVREAAITTIQASTMVLWLVLWASIFGGFDILEGGQRFFAASLVGSGLGPYGILLVMMLILIVMGMFLDWVGILLLAVPIFAPIMLQLMFQFDGLLGLPGVVDPADDPETAKQKMQLWFGAVYMVNMQMSFLRPPFAHFL